MATNILFTLNGFYKMLQQIFISILTLTYQGFQELYMHIKLGEG